MIETMDFEEAKESIKSAGKLYRAYVDGRVWDAGRMVDVCETIGYYATREEADAACADYRMFYFDDKHLDTYVEEVDDGEFAD